MISLTLQCADENVPLMSAQYKLINYYWWNTLIAYEMSMHPDPFVVGWRTGGMTEESNSTLVWSPGASSLKASLLLYVS